jgi:plasmid stabilization system protein ParE
LKSIRLSATARRYVRQETAYLRQHSTAAARNFRQQLQSLQHRLADFPNIGSQSAGLPITGLRRLVMGNYVVDYQIRGDVIDILTIRHGRQKEQPLPLDDDVDYED